MQSILFLSDNMFFFDGYKPVWQICCTAIWCLIDALGNQYIAIRHQIKCL